MSDIWNQSAQDQMREAAQKERLYKSMEEAGKYRMKQDSFGNYTYQKKEEDESK